MFEHVHSHTKTNIIFISTSIALVILAFIANAADAQDTLSGGKALNIPFKKFGLSIGNSQIFNGIRINFRDKNVKHLNGINLTLWYTFGGNPEAVINGINIGHLPSVKVSQPITIGFFGAGATKLNGFAFGTFALGSGGNINGLSISGIYTLADGNNSHINGLALSGLILSAKQAICGIAIAGLTIETNNLYGLSISLYNRTDNLQGLQIGLLNYAGNNPRGLRWLPVLNLHLGNSQKQPSIK